MRTKAALLLVLSFLVGCGGEPTQISGGTPPPAVSPPGPAYAAVRLVRPVSDVPVEVLENGTLVRQTHTRTGGAAFLGQLPPRCRLVAHLPSGLTLSREVHPGHGRWLWISPATTLVSRYAQRHPDLPLETAEERVRQYLGIPAGVDLGSALGDSYRSPFSWKAFVKAAGSTPLNEFMDRQVARVGSGARATFRQPDPYPRLHALFDPAGTPVSARGVISGKFFENLVTNVLGDVATDGLGKILGSVTEALGLNFGTAKQLDEIESQLTDIQSQLAEMQTELVAITVELSSLQTELEQDFQSLSAQIQQDEKDTLVVNSLTLAKSVLNASTNRILTHVQALLDMLAGFGTPTSVQVPVASVPAGASEFAQQLHLYAAAASGSLFDDLDALRQHLQGLSQQPNVVTANGYLHQQLYGNDSPTAANLFCDVRTNAALTRQQEFLDFYRGYQVLALLLLSEWAHLDGVTFPGTGGSTGNSLAANLPTAQKLSLQMASDLVVQQQQVPLPIIGGEQSPIDDVLVDVRTNCMWYTTMYFQEVVSLTADPLSQQDIPAGSVDSTLEAFALGPWPAGMWRLPNKAELDSLSTYAMTAGGGNAVKGLEQMGFDLGGDADESTPISFLMTGTSDPVGVETNSAGSFPLESVVFENEFEEPISLYTLGQGVVNGDPPSNTSYNFLLVRTCPGLTDFVPGTHAGSALLVAQSSPPHLEPEDPATAVATAVPSSLVPVTAAGGLGVQGQLTYTTPALSRDNINGLTQALDYTKLVCFSSTNSSAVDVSNLPGLQGTLTFHTATPGNATVTASLLTSFTGSALNPAWSNTTCTFTTLPGTPSTPTLASILVTPDNKVYSVAASGFAQDFYFATGFYSDGSVRDLTDNVTWSTANVSVSGGGTPQFAGNQLQLPQSLGTGNLTLTATFGGQTGLAMAGLAGW